MRCEPRTARAPAHSDRATKFDISAHFEKTGRLMAEPKTADTFTDPMVDCKTCKARFRADQMAEIPCPQKPSKMAAGCHGEKTEARPFNLMFETTIGPIRSEENMSYLRPETAQAIFVQFKN